MESIEPFIFQTPSLEDTRNEIEELNRQELLRTEALSLLRHAMNEGDQLLDIFQSRNFSLEPGNPDRLDDEEALVAIGGLLKYHFSFTTGMEFEWPIDSTDAQDKVFTVQDELTIETQSYPEFAGDHYFTRKTKRINIADVNLGQLLGKNEFESLKQLALVNLNGQEPKPDQQEVDSALKYILNLLFNAPSNQRDSLPKQRVQHLKYLDYYQQWNRRTDFQKALQKVVLDVYGRAANLATRAQG